MKNAPLVINPKIVIKIFNCSYDCAKKKVQRVRKELTKKKSDPITLSEFCKAVNLPFDETREFLSV